MTEKNKGQKNYGKKKIDKSALSDALKSNIKRRKEMQIKKKVSVESSAT